MDSAVRMRTTVLPGQRIEIASPLLHDGEEVDVVVTVRSPQVQPPRQQRPLQADEGMALAVPSNANMYMDDYL